jgi:hypothetical protein
MDESRVGWRPNQTLAVTGERWQEIDRIVTGALKLSGDAREDFLKKSCGHDRDLRTEVDSLLAAEDGGPWDKPVFLNLLDSGELDDAIDELDVEIDESGIAGEEWAGLDSDGDAANVPWGLGDGRATDPVVGWLVCVEGTSCGRDFPLRAEKNFVGLSETMDICVAPDERVSRERLAVVAFDPRNLEFRLLSGSPRHSVFINGARVELPTVLIPYDEVALDHFTLLFIPFCGEYFQW